MSLIVMESFDGDTGTTVKWQSLLAASATTHGAVRTGNGIWLNGNGNARMFARDLAAAEKDDIIMFGAYALTGSGGNDVWFRLWGSGSGPSTWTDHIELGRTGDDRLRVYRGGFITDTATFGTGTLLAETAAGFWPNNQGKYIEFKAKIGNGDGTLYLRVNGTVAFDLSGLDTNNGAPDNLAKTIDFWGDGTNVRWDDLYVLNGLGSINNDLLGDCVVLAQNPNGNGNYSEWDGSDGNSVNNYQLVDEEPFSSTDYVSTSTAGDRDTYAFSNLSGVSDILAAQIVATGGKTDSVATRTLRLMARDGGGTEIESGDFDVPQTAGGKFFLAMDTQPDTTAWNVTDFDACEFGYKLQA